MGVHVIYNPTMSHSIYTGSRCIRVRASQVTDPANLALVGLPPFDLLDELATALRAKGLDIDEVFQKSVSCSKEFIYDPCRKGALRDRFAQKYNSERSIPIKWRSIHETLNPQPLANVNYKHLIF